ncbi:patatin-like phospholipase family protein [Halegenticoccus soli]|uniref:patatin-like phospholipase family protein n=1 Tax=Halegenticoccus soli TaxID=1985678 RepID=UPI000C6EE8EE|nr:patatin-like phospholipase family protein [Halegenticoccus soli]
MSDDAPRKVAIACQGGGSHTAFTGGALQHLLSNSDEEYELVGMSGASGGAVCALTAWSGLHNGGEREAATRLTSLWKALSANTWFERLQNDALVRGVRMADVGIGLPQVSPYAVPYTETAVEDLEETLRDHIDFEGLRRSTAEDVLTRISAVDVNDGTFKTFSNEDVSVESLLASMAVPNLFEAVKLDPTSDPSPSDPRSEGDSPYDGDYHWDGLFSQNPPVRDFLERPAGIENKPDEIWIVRINPQRAPGEPTTLAEIGDRRNELAGNLSLNQELRFIRQVNEWLDDGTIREGGAFKTVRLRCLELDGAGLDWSLDPASKLDRSPEFVAALMRRGRDQARDFLANPDDDAYDCPRT